MWPRKSKEPKAIPAPPTEPQPIGIEVVESGPKKPRSEVFESSYFLLYNHYTDGSADNAVHGPYKSIADAKKRLEYVTGLNYYVIIKLPEIGATR